LLGGALQWFFAAMWVLGFNDGLFTYLPPPVEIW
jgi:hypothetical protein